MAFRKLYTAPMLAEVLAGIIVATVVGLAGWLVRSGRLHDSASFIAMPFERHGTRTGDGLGPTHRVLLTMLLRDQSRWGRHKGEFGRSASLAESKKYNLSHERMSTKPRMYMTRWPCVVLHRQGLAPAAVQRAVAGITALFANGLIAGEAGWDPIPGQGRRQLDNYRHTMCGALILLELKGWNQISRDVLGIMLDRDNQWQNTDGGWAHTSPLPSPSDLYSSLYAIQLLHLAMISDKAPLTLAHSASRALESSLSYLSTYWHQSGWAFGELSSEEIFPQAFVEVADILRSKRPELYSAVVERLVSQLNPAGGLGHQYRERTDRTVSDERHLARLAYATYRARQPSRIWLGLATAALGGNIETLTSVEAAFLIDMRLSQPKETLAVAPSMQSAVTPESLRPGRLGTS